MLCCIYYIKIKYLLRIVTAVTLAFIFFQTIFYSNILNDKNVPVLVWWTPFFPKGERLTQCDNGYQCLITSDRSHKLHAYLFYGSQIENHDFPVPRNNQIPWAIFHEESPRNYAPFLFEDFQNLFNITSTFSRNSDFPVTLQYLSDRNLKLLSNKKYYVPVHEKNKYLPEIAPVLYIQSDCDTPIGRDYLVKELSKFVKIDSFGNCLRNRTFPDKLNQIDSLDLFNDIYLQFISKYKFIIAFENAICDDYITEKLWRPLIVGAVPIYFGSPTIEDWLPNKNSAILVKNLDSLEAVGKYINEVNNDDSLYESFLEHKIYSRIQNKLLQNQVLNDHPLTSFECYVCKKLHTKNISEFRHRKNVYNCLKPVANDNNTWNQHWDVGKCQAKALKELIEKGKLYSKEQYDQMWKRFYYDKQC